MEEADHRRFALSGSSARKLKRGAANLLAGRAVVRHLFPLTSAETGFTVPMAQLLRFGALPLSVNAANDEAREDFLRAYLTTYLSEEIRAEGLVRNLGGFSRFLEVAALAASRTTNVSGIARDAGVSRETARGYFEVLVDTLIAEWLPAYRPRAKVKERALPKLYSRVDAGEELHRLSRSARARTGWDAGAAAGGVPAPAPRRGDRRLMSLARRRDRESSRRPSRRRRFRRRYHQRGTCRPRSRVPCSASRRVRLRRRRSSSARRF